MPRALVFLKNGKTSFQSFWNLEKKISSMSHAEGNYIFFFFLSECMPVIKVLYKKVFQNMFLLRSNSPWEILNLSHFFVKKGTKPPKFHEKCYNFLNVAIVISLKLSATRIHLGVISNILNFNESF